MWISACATQPKTQTLYDELGGQEAIDEIVGYFIQNIGHDPQIFHYFDEANVTRFRQMFSTHLCHLIDGPCTYDGDSMIDIHTGMLVNERDFNHTVDLLIDAMYKANIPHPTQNKVLARLVPLRQGVIYQ
jgi:hemoglobin